MRWKVMILATSLTMSLTAALAGAVEMDFSDYDDDLMRDLDRSIKVLEPDINGKNPARVAEDAQVLLEGFKYAEDYFAKKGVAPEAVKIAQAGSVHVSDAMRAVEAKDFEGAANAAREAAHTCRSCHDAYKPAKH